MSMSASAPLRRNEHPDAIGFDTAKSPPAQAAGGNGEPQLSRATSRLQRPLPNLHTSSSSPVYGHRVCESPVSDYCDESMSIHRDHAKPPTSPPRGHSPAEKLSQLSLGRAHHASPRASRGREVLPTAAAKRAASTELPRPPGRSSPNRFHVTGPRHIQRNPKAPRRGHHGRALPHCVSLGDSPQRPMSGSLKTALPAVQSHDIFKQRMDSGYDSPGARGNSVPEPDTRIHPAAVPPTIDEGSNSGSSAESDIDVFKWDEKYPGLILQPDSSPISQEQLADEVKGIYAGLVMVEAKCINIDAAEAANPKSQLGSEQWQALIALHRTLLYEHHDFLMATQHPSASPALRVLATKYSMPARMWKHGIHAFLEVLRHRRPESQDHMLSFIYLAYQMMALLFETVPIFTDTWIECLGDLARYRMAIEEEKEAHATWGGVAARWYTMASDRHPTIGRLYHHLGILERPSLRKLCYYAKSLTCVIGFPNARDSLSTLCGPIVQDDQTIESSIQSAEARIVTFHALVLSHGNSDTISHVASTALDLVLDTPSKLRDFGAYLGITNTAALFEFGSPNNILFQQYTTVINLAMQASRPSSTSTATPGNNTRHTLPLPVTITNTAVVPMTTPSASLDISKDFWLQTFDLVLRSFGSGSALCDSLAYVHVMLVCVHSLHALRTRLLNGQSPTNTCDLLVDFGELPWDTLAVYLNTVAQSSPISARLVGCARQGIVLAPERKEDARPLPEDYLLRGLIWAQFYFPPRWFDGQAEDDGRAVEGETTLQSRMKRVLWLGLYLAFHTGYLQYDVYGRVFSATTPTTAQDLTNGQLAETVYADAECQTDAEHFSQVSNPSERNSRGPSSASSSNSEDDFVHVSASDIKAEQPASRPPAAAKQQKDTWAQIARPKKTANKNAKIMVAGGEEMEWSRDNGIRRGDALS